MRATKLIERQITRSEFLRKVRETFPSKKQFKWVGNPKIGWWEDNDPLILYHGTRLVNLPKILKNGIFAPSSGPTANWVSMALEPNTAFGYASMGGETNFRSAGAKAKHIPPNQRVVVVAKIPRSVVMNKIDKDLRGNVGDSKARLMNRDEYENWKGSDQEYYALSELRFPKKIDPQYIVGWMVKK